MPVLALLLVSTLQTALPPPPKRNVLVVVFDDVGVDRVGAYGTHPDAGPTPVLDQLAAEGVLFRNATSEPVCSPTRTTILQGQYGRDSGIGISVPWNDLTSINGQFAPVGPLLPELLPGPVRAAAIGKWHLDTLTAAGHDAPIDRGFELYRGNPTGEFLPPEGYYGSTRVVADSSGASLSWDTTYATTREVDDALAVIAGFGRDPWFVWLGLHAAHAPFEPPPPHLHSFGDLAGTDDTIVYRAMVEAADAEVGRLLASMDPRTLERTTVIVLGDNGTPGDVTTPPTDPEHAKGHLHQGGVHVPLIVWGAAVVDPGREVTALVNTIDLFQTVLDLLGAGDGGRPDSISIAPYLRSAAAPPRRTWVHARRHAPNGDGPYDELERGMVRDERYKLIRRVVFFGIAQEFYDLQVDPYEVNDLPIGTLTPEQREHYLALRDLLDELGGP